MTAAQSLARAEWLRLKANTPRRRLAPRRVRDAELEAIKEQIRTQRRTRSLER
jgi:hypothetical protein